MILSFGWKRLAFPARVRGGFRMAHIDGPVGRQWNFFKHRTVAPGAITKNPKLRVANIGLFEPVPRISGPQSAVFVTTGKDEFKKIGVRHVVDIDLEFRDEYRVRLEFVIPAKYAVGRLA